MYLAANTPALLLLVLALPLAVPTTLCQAQVAPAELEAARRKVYQFERPLAEKITDQFGEADVRLSPEYQKPIRKYFAELASGPMKLAAIEMLDNRYVHIVERKLAAELLGPLVRDADPHVKARAAKAIAYNDCGAAYADELIAMLQGTPSQEAIVNVAAAMSKTDHEAFVPHLEHWTEHPAGEVRIAVGMALAMLVPETAFEQYLRLLHDPTTRVRKVAVQQLPHCKDQRALALTEQMLHDPEPEVRERAVWTLGVMRSQNSGAVIARLLADPHHHVRGRAAEVLGKLQTAEHAPAIAALLNDDNVVVRRYAVMGLGHMQQAKYLDVLRPLLNDADDLIRRNAAESIEQIEAVSDTDC
jgi:HEAT repeat protein